MKGFKQGNEIKDFKIGGRAASYEAAKPRVMIKSFEVRQTATPHDLRKENLFEPESSHLENEYNRVIMRLK